MRVIDIYNKRKKPVFSIEFFPPRNGETLDKIFSTIDELKIFAPGFASVTGGALGSQRGGTIAIVGSIKRKYNIEGVVHLTCVNKSKQDLENLLMEIKYNDIENVLALRGDPPRDSSASKDYLPDYKYAYQLVKHINLMNNGEYLGESDGISFKGEPAGFCVSVAAYPENHPESASAEENITHLKMKIDAGADYVITQMFFDIEKFLRFRDLAAKRGVTIPIVPGLMPVEKYKQVNFLLKQMGISIPSNFRQMLDSASDNPEKVKEICHNHDLNMARELIAAGVPGIHFFTMNRPEGTKRILERITDGSS